MALQTSLSLHAKLRLGHFRKHVYVRIFSTHTPLGTSLFLEKEHAYICEVRGGVVN